MRDEPFQISTLLSCIVVQRLCIQALHVAPQLQMMEGLPNNPVGYHSFGDSSGKPL